MQHRPQSIQRNIPTPNLIYGFTFCQGMLYLQYLQYDLYILIGSQFTHKYKLHFFFCSSESIERVCRRNILSNMDSQKNIDIMICFQFTQSKSFPCVHLFLHAACTFHPHCFVKCFSSLNAFCLVFFSFFFFISFIVQFPQILCAIYFQNVSLGKYFC